MRGESGELMDHAVKLVEEEQESVTDNAQHHVHLMEEKTVREYRQSQSLVISNYVQVSKSA